MNMMKFMKKLGVLTALVVTVMALSIPAFASVTEKAPETAAVEATEEEAETEGSGIGAKAIAAGVAIGLAAAGGAVGMGIATSKSVESISRQPEAESKIRTTLMLGLVFVETAIIYALLVVILIIFVL